MRQIIKLIFFITLIVFFNISLFSNSLEVRMLNNAKIFEAYSFKGGQFTTINKVAEDVDYNDETGVYAIEGNPDAIDTPAEFLTAAYLSPVKIENVNYSVINEELPPGKVGATKLCGVWALKAFNYTFSKGMDPAKQKQQIANYYMAIKMLKEKEGISDKELRETFATLLKTQNEDLFREVLNTVDVNLSTGSYTIERLSDGFFVENGGHVATIPNGADAVAILRSKGFREDGIVEIMKVIKQPEDYYDLPIDPAFDIMMDRLAKYMSYYVMDPATMSDADKKAMDSAYKELVQIRIDLLKSANGGNNFIDISASFTKTIKNINEGFVTNKYNDSFNNALSANLKYPVSYKEPDLIPSSTNALIKKALPTKTIADYEKLLKAVEEHNKQYIDN